MSIFDDRESNVRTYCRSFPNTFHRAKGSILYSESGEEYIDFFAAAGSLNYGHNNDFIKREVMKYLESDAVIQGLDMHTTAKRDFLSKFTNSILEPRGLDYKVQFCGPTGTNAVEAALKLARKAKNRPGVFSFMGGYHGMSLGSLSVTGNLSSREAAGRQLTGTTFIPYPGSSLPWFDSIAYIETILKDPSSGIEKPAAIILETVQAEGGVNVAPVSWLQDLRALCDRHDILMICDDIQVGCGRTGPFFSFERAAIIPDMVVVSKSISGYGGPMSLLLMKRELDVWKPAEHTGTFRGYQLAMVGATAALEYRRIEAIEERVRARETHLVGFLGREIASLGEDIGVRGIGLIWGIDLSRFGGEALAARISARCYELGLIVERAGRDGTVIKIMPPLTIEQHVLEQGCAILKRAFTDCLDCRYGYEDTIPSAVVSRVAG